MHDDIYELKEAERLKEAEKQKGMGWCCGTYNGVLVGVICLVVGAALLLGNVTGFYLHNWWALFILIPAVAKLSQAWDAYRRHGRLTEKAAGALSGGLCIAFIAAVFLVGLSWHLLWPLALIMLGIGGLARAAVR